MADQYYKESTGKPRELMSPGRIGRMRGFRASQVSEFERRMDHAIGVLKDTLRQASSYRVIRKTESGEVLDLCATRDFIYERGYLERIRHVVGELRALTHGKAHLDFDPGSGLAKVYVLGRVVDEYDFSHFDKRKS